MNDQPTTVNTPVDVELSIMESIVNKMAPLDACAQARVVEYISARYPQFDYERSTSFSFGGDEPTLVNSQS